MSMDVESRVKLLAHWIRERQLIHQRRFRDLLPPPWTLDPILKQYRFCNVERENDRVTMWIASHWRDPNHDHPNLTAAMVLARMLNNPETLGELGFPSVWLDNDIRFIIKARRDRGHKILNPAYLITTCGVAMDKVDYIVDIASHVQSRGIKFVEGETLSSAAATLMSHKGLGSFLSAQVVADLKNTPRHPLSFAPDWWTWAAVGPGSIKGLRAVLARPDVRESQFLGLATLLYKETQDVYMVSYGIPLVLHMQDFQNCLCEFSKYWRAHTGEGKPKQNFTPRD